MECRHAGEARRQRRRGTSRAERMGSAGVGGDKGQGRVACKGDELFSF